MRAYADTKPESSACRRIAAWADRLVALQDLPSPDNVTTHAGGGDPDTGCHGARPPQRCRAAAGSGSCLARAVWIDLRA